MLFGSDAAEDSLISQRFVLKAIADFKYLEDTIFNVVLDTGLSCKIEFKLSELPNDMKMLCCLAGEISNAAHYFTTFADVNSSNSRKIRSTFGVESHHVWKPFPYQKRLDIANKVASKKKQEAAKYISADQKRRNLLDFIRKLESRQEFIPLVGDYID